MSVTFRRATTGYMAAGGYGVAYAFWERVERARVARQLSKTDLAELAGVTRPTIERLRTASRAPMARNVHKIADALEIPRDEAERLAGLLPPERIESRTLRELENDPAFSPRQRDLLRQTALELLRSNRAGQEPDLRVVPPVGDAEQTG